MHEYTLEYTDSDGVTKTITFAALSPNCALDQARAIAPGRWATLKDENGEICRVERLSSSEVWLIASVDSPIGV